MRMIVLVLLLAACGSQPPVTSPGDPGMRPSNGDGRPHASPPDASEDRDITLASLDGALRALGAYRARVTVVALWASYCAPCLRELHLIEALHQKYRDHDEVTVLLVSIDDLDQGSRDTIAGILAQKSMTVPALIDHRHQLIDRVAPRDARGKPFHAVPMLVVVDERFRLRRKLDLGHSLDAAVFLAGVTPLVDAALRGEDVPPDAPYEAPLGSGFTAKRTMTLTVQDLKPHQVKHYLEDLRHQIAKKYPDLHDHQLDDLMVEIEKKLQGSGTFKVEIPPPHTGAH